MQLASHTRFLRLFPSNKKANLSHKWGFVAITKFRGICVYRLISSWKSLSKMLKPELLKKVKQGGYGISPPALAWKKTKTLCCQMGVWTTAELSFYKFALVIMDCCYLDSAWSGGTMARGSFGLRLSSVWAHPAEDLGQVLSLSILDMSI